jgi:hypothetical protein
MASGSSYSVSGHYLGALLRLDQRVRFVTGLARSVRATSASGQRDCSVFKCLMAIFEGVRL